MLRSPWVVCRGWRFRIPGTTAIWEYGRNLCPAYIRVLLVQCLTVHQLQHLLDYHALFSTILGPDRHQ